MKGDESAALFDVLCCGMACYDLSFMLASHPASDEKVSAKRLVMCGGGPAANASVAVKRLGGSAAFCGFIASDHFGTAHLRELTEAGVDCTLVFQETGSATPLSAILVKENGERCVVNYRENLSRKPPALPSRLIKFKSLLIDGHEKELSNQLIEIAKAEGSATVLDAGSVRPSTLDLAEKVDYLICSERFASDYSGSSDSSDYLILLTRLNRNVAVTLGSKGCIYIFGSDSGRIPAQEVSVVDTNGAGDAFHAAFALCIARGTKPVDALQCATDVAALTCEKLGGRAGFPTWEEVAARFRDLDQY
ncbi:MAG: carbohydrate kinase [Deltaproteobacteria bacterium]|nr:carbohydrate kinase [Deltaproteobacteria bacterium]